MNRQKKGHTDENDKQDTPNFVYKEKFKYIRTPTCCTTYRLVVKLSLLDYGCTTTTYALLTFQVHKTLIQHIGNISVWLWKFSKMIESPSLSDLTLNSKWKICTWIVWFSWKTKVIISTSTSRWVSLYSVLTDKQTDGQTYKHW